MWPKYTELDDSEKSKLIKDNHTNGDYSISQLASLTGTYINKIRRDAIRLGIKIDTQSEAQKKSLKTGFRKHPTEGTTRPNDVKEKIGKTQRETWKELDSNSKKKIIETRKKRYKKQKNKPHMSPNKVVALQDAAKHGSKIELHLLDYLSQYWDCTHHYSGKLGQEDYHIDIVIPKLKIAIEVDGPAHFKPIWNEEKLSATQTKDERKNVVIRKAGFTLVRFIADKKYSVAYGNEAGEALYNKCLEIQKKGKMKNVQYVKI